MKTKKLLSLLLATGLIFSAAQALPAQIRSDAEAPAATQGGAGACTMIYMGNGVTDDGAFFYGRTEDISAKSAKLFTVIPAANHKPGEFYRSSDPASIDFRWPYPPHSLRYTALRDPVKQYDVTYLGNETWIEASTNESGVSVSATVTLSAGKTSVIAADPFGGASSIGEADIPSVIAMQAKTAREGCELIAKVIDAVGAKSAEGFMVSDPHEAWYFQILSGHQYAAVKCPDDMIGFSPNLTANVSGGPGDCLDVSDTENVIASKRIVSLPKGLGLLIGDPADTGNPNKIMIADTYAKAPSNYQSGRLRVGYGYLYGLTKKAEIAAKYPDAKKYPDFFVEPRNDYKYSLYDAMRMLACRGEGTEWEIANPVRNDSSIGNAATVEAHVFEVRPWMPAETATIKWVCMAPPEFGVYLPFYGSLITDVYHKYYDNEEALSYDSADPEDNTVFWVFRELYAQCAASSEFERSRLGDGVRAFWARYQKSLIEQQAQVDEIMLRVLESDGRQAASKLATDASMKLAEETCGYANQMLAELKAFKASGAPGPFIPSSLADPGAIPRYADTVRSMSGYGAYDDAFGSLRPYQNFD